MSARVGLVEAVRDKQLLGAGLDPWPGQLDLLRTVEDGLERGVWLNVWNVGRRGSKSTLIAVIGLWSCLLRGDLDELAGPAGRSYAAIAATNVGQSRLVVGMARDLVLASPLLAPMLEGSSLDELQFANRTGFLAFPASSRAARGRALRFAAVDEAAHFGDSGSGSDQEAGEIFKALTPALGQFMPNAVFVVSSTPAGPSGWFAETHARASAGEIPGAQAVTMASSELNPRLSPEWLASERERDPFSFEQEFLAQFTGGGGQLFDESALEAAIVADGERHPSEATGWLGALDVGFTRDPFGACVVGFDHDDPRRLVLGSCRRWDPPARRDRPTTATGRRQLQDRVLGEVGALFDRFNVKRAAFDGYEAPIVREVLRGVELEQLTLTSSARMEIFSSLRARLASGTLSLYRDELLLSEMRRIRLGYRNGQLQVLLPRSRAGHFDAVVSLAMACWLADRREAPGTALPHLVDVSEADRRLPSLSIFGSDRSRLPRTADAVRSYRF